MDFYYFFLTDCRYTDKNIIKILEHGAKLGYSFRIPTYISGNSGNPESLDIETATKFLIKEHPLSRWYSGIEAHKNNGNTLEFDAIDKNDFLQIDGGGYFETYSDIVGYMPNMIEILRPFKINNFQMQEEYFIDTKIPTPGYHGPIIYCNRFGIWPVLKQNISAAGFKILDKPHGSEIDVALSDKGKEYRYELTAFLQKDEIIIKAQISGSDLCLMPFPPYVQHKYESGADIDTAFYLDFLFKLAKGAEALDFIEAKNF